MSALVRAEGLGVRFLFDRQSRGVTPTLARLRRRGTETWGLSNLTFAIRPGDGVALLGPSGSGKTTLLRVIAGVFVPDTGEIEVQGRIGSLLSTDAGLLSALTGRENAALLGVLAGRSRSESRAATDGVIARSRLEHSFDRPVSSYSQGMRARLGLTVAEEALPEILLLDEVHEALDHKFRVVIAAHANAIREAGGIVVAAGHDHPLLAEFCSSAMFLLDGQQLAYGPFDEVLRTYLESPAA
jgi:ABC-type polysaccharide/polyol phosphate transport system ATPase subunit